jgi:hypothetical protein
MGTVKPPIDRIDGPREDLGRDFRGRGRIGLGMVVAAEALGLVRSIGYPLLLEAFVRSEGFSIEWLEILKPVGWAIGFVTTLIAWIGLALLARVPKVGAFALAAVAVGVLQWVVPSSGLLLSKLGASPGGLASPFTLLKMMGAVLASAHSVLLVVVARQAADGLSGKRSRLVEIALYVFLAVLLVSDVGSVALFNHYPASSHGALLDQYGLAFHVVVWLSRLTQLLLIGLFLQVLVTTKRRPTAEPP